MHSECEDGSLSSSEDSEADTEEASELETESSLQKNPTKFETREPELQKS